MWVVMLHTLCFIGTSVKSAPSGLYWDWDKQCFLISNTWSLRNVTFLLVSEEKKKKSDLNVTVIPLFCTYILVSWTHPCLKVLVFFLPIVLTCDPAYLLTYLFSWFTKLWLVLISVHWRRSAVPVLTGRSVLSYEVLLTGFCLTLRSWLDEVRTDAFGGT